MEGAMSIQHALEVFEHQGCFKLENTALNLQMILYLQEEIKKRKDTLANPYYQFKLRNIRLVPTLPSAIMLNVSREIKIDLSDEQPRTGTYPLDHILYQARSSVHETNPKQIDECLSTFVLKFEHQRVLESALLGLLDSNWHAIHLNNIFFSFGGAEETLSIAFYENLFKQLMNYAQILQELSFNPDRFNQAYLFGMLDKGTALKTLRFDLHPQPYDDSCIQEFALKLATYSQIECIGLDAIAFNEAAHRCLNQFFAQDYRIERIELIKPTRHMRQGLEKAGFFREVARSTEFTDEEAKALTPVFKFQ
jgi:hypothetical protein